MGSRHRWQWGPRSKEDRDKGPRPELLHKSKEGVRWGFRSCLSTQTKKRRGYSFWVYPGSTTELSNSKSKYRFRSFWLIPTVIQRSWVISDRRLLIFFFSLLFFLCLEVSFLLGNLWMIHLKMREDYILNWWSYISRNNFIIIKIKL